MRLTKYILTPILAIAMFSACDSFVEDTDLPIDSIDDVQLNDESQVAFVIKGIQSRFSTTYDRLAVFAGGLSDEFFFDQRVPNATFPSFREMDEGDIPFANNSVDGVYNDLGELRLFSDNLLERVAEITFEDAALKTEAEFTGNLYGGLSRYFFATYIGLTPEEGGGVISDDPENPGPFIPAAPMYQQAIDKLTAARTLADEYHTRVINTVLARIYLFQGDTGNARTAAAGGMVAGDEPFSSLHATDNTNYYYTQAGPGRTQFVVDFRFQGYVDADPTEAARIPLAVITGNDDPPTTFYRQDKYPERETPLPFATWQENDLMLAELDVREGGGSPAALIDGVRASHSVGPLGAASITLDEIIAERERELFTMGIRLPDQRRFNIWHLAAGTWQYLPITQSERNINSNF